MSSEEDIDDTRSTLPPPRSRNVRSADTIAKEARRSSERSRDATRRYRDFSEALRTLGRVFDHLETAQLHCSVLEAEKSQSEVTTEKMLQGAFARIEDLEAVVAGLMRILAKYDSLLSLSNGRRHEAEQRAAHAESRSKEAERGASDAVEWLYRYMSDSLHAER